MSQKLENKLKYFYAYFTQMYFEIATANVTKIKNISRIFLWVFVTQMYLEIATENVTIFKKKSKIFL